jgi:hypothetical protein
MTTQDNQNDEPDNGDGSGAGNQSGPAIPDRDEGPKIGTGSAPPCACSCSCRDINDAEPADDHRQIIHVTGRLTAKDSRDHALARLGWNRTGHRVTPGLYAIGDPCPDSPVIVTANYTLSFDAVRSALDGISAYILVLDTKGINVWCAAGKGTFGTAEVTARILMTHLASVVRHRRLILPQLGAPGVSAHAVHAATGFHVEYGPVRAADLPEFLRTRDASPEMRTVTFDLRDRIVLIPVEFMHILPYALLGTIALLLVGGPLPASAFLAAVLAGTMLFPALLPFLPTRDFSTKGFILGVCVAVPFAAWAAVDIQAPVLVKTAAIIAILLSVSAISAYLSLNFTGSTPFTSRTGVRKEIFRYIPPMFAAGAGGALCALAVAVSRVLGMW